MRLIRCIATVAAVLAAGPSALAAPPGRTLTKDGKLAQKLVVRDVRGGFAGFTGAEWSVDPSGAFVVSGVQRGKAEPRKKGDLRPEALQALVKALARCDGAKELTPAKKFTGANPRVVTVTLGGRTLTLTLPRGQELPKVDPNKVPATEEEWFAAVLQAVQQVAGKLPR
jgi:hypothetical protein